MYDNDWQETRKEIRSHIQKKETKKKNSDIASQFFSYNLHQKQHFSNEYDHSPLRRLQTASDLTHKINSLFKEPHRIRPQSPKRKADEHQLNNQQRHFRNNVVSSNSPKRTKIMNKIRNLDLKFKALPVQIKQIQQHSPPKYYGHSPPMKFEYSPSKYYDHSPSRQKLSPQTYRKVTTVDEKIPLQDILKLKGQLGSLSSRDQNQLTSNYLSQLMDLQSTIAKLVKYDGK